MMGEAIAFFLGNLPAVMLVLSLGLWLLPGGRRDAASLLGWVLLLPIGVTGLWAGVMHVAFPGLAAAYIGWAVSPFQFEVGMADLSIGVTACLGFWRDWEFRAAAVCAAAIFLLGDAAGHVRQMVGTGNFAPGNAGVPFYMDIIAPVLAIVLLLTSRRGGPER
jgi:Family of unknown function (DUF6790)